MVSGASPFPSSGPVSIFLFCFILAAILTTFSHKQHSGQYSSVSTSLDTRHTALLGSTCQLGSLLCWLRKFSKMVGHTIQALPGGNIPCSLQKLLRMIRCTIKALPGGGIPCSLRKLSQMVGRTIQALPGGGILCSSCKFL